MEILIGGRKGLNSHFNFNIEEIIKGKMAREKDGFTFRDRTGNWLFRKRFFVFLLLGIFFVVVFVGGVERAYINSDSE